MKKPTVWLWMLFWSVFVGFAITGLLVVLPQPTWVHFVAAVVICAVVSIPFSMSAGKALMAGASKPG